MRRGHGRRYWALWSVTLGVAVTLLYVILTPVWIGLPGACVPRGVQGAAAALTEQARRDGLRTIRRHPIAAHPGTVGH